MNNKYFVSFANIASIFILCFSIPFAISFYRNLSSEYNYNLKIGRGFVGNEAIYFSVKMNPEAEDSSSASDSDYSEQFTGQLLSIFGESDFLIVSQLGVVRAAAYQGEGVLPPILSGRFFTAQESLESRKLAVIGNSFIDDIKHVDGVPVISLDYGEYEVVGVLGLQQVSLLDELIFINAGSVEAKTLQSGLFYIDSSQVSPTNLFETLSSQLLATGLYSIHQIDMFETAVDIISGGIFFSGLLEAIIYSFLILVFLCTLVFFVQISRLRASVLMLNGYSIIQIVRRLSFFVFVAGSSGLLLSIIIGILMAIYGFFRLPSVSVLSSLFLASIFSVIAMLLFPITLFIFIRKINLAESLR